MQRCSTEVSAGPSGRKGPGVLKRHQKRATESHIRKRRLLLKSEDRMFQTEKELCSGTEIWWVLGRIAERSRWLGQE